MREQTGMRHPGRGEPVSFLKGAATAQVQLMVFIDAVRKNGLNYTITSSFQGKTERWIFTWNLLNLYFRIQLNKTKLCAGQTKLKAKSIWGWGLAPGWPWDLRSGATSSISKWRKRIQTTEAARAKTLSWGRAGPSRREDLPFHLWPFTFSCGHSKTGWTSSDLFQ